MKALILMLTVVTLPLTAPAQESPNPKSTTYVAPTPELFRDPFRKVKNDKGELVNADLRPLFTWFQKRRGERPMKIWGRTAVTTIENHPTGVLVSNNSDKKVFFLRNYPYKVPPGSVIQFFSVDSGFYDYKDSAGNESTVHASDYGIPYNPATEKKAAPKKEDAGKATNAVPKK